MLFLLLLVISTSCAIKCRDGDLLSDPSDCHRFFKCAGGKPRSLRCPKGLVFNSLSKTCDWPQFVNCESTNPDEIEDGEKKELADIFIARKSEHSKNPIEVGLSITPGLRSSPNRDEPKIFFSAPPGSSVVKRKKPDVPKLTTSSLETSYAPVKSINPALQSKPKKTNLASLFHSSLKKIPVGHRFKPVTATKEEKNLVLSNCGIVSKEPITKDIINVRLDTCTLDTALVQLVKSGRKGNPSNVKMVQSILSEEEFHGIFHLAHNSYTYNGLLQAIAKFPSFCGSSLSSCRSSLAMLLAHIQQETEGLKYIRESKSSCGSNCNYCSETAWVQEGFPCYPGVQYYGRGAKQLSWNYNYGQFSLAIFGTEKILLRNPELVATSWLNFASAIWFFITPQSPKPSLQNIASGLGEYRKYGFGDSIRVINGGLECGEERSPLGTLQASNRIRYYRAFSFAVGIDVDEASLDCPESIDFDHEASLYWAPELGCTLSSWQTAHSALLEGEWKKCLTVSA